MTDQELDNLMREILLDAIALDEEDCKDRILFEPSLKHQRQIGTMLKDPLRWAKERRKPAWKKVWQRAAVILLVATLSFGSVMAASPAVRAAVLRWITEWYETYVSYRYMQETSLPETMPETMPEYEITALPEGYEENISERVEWPNYVQRRYENADEEIIFFDYIYMTDGSLTSLETDGAAAAAVTVNGHEGLFFCSEYPGADSTLSWIDTNQNLHFTISAAMEQKDMLHMAESVSLSEMTK